mmetsp:Transcript_21108/g.31874  ORF Transcript_21108/g.31874 Transcript_21108/m.31874 type:complete len:88 (+) Transcript_21108:843-1106(+)
MFGQFNQPLLYQWEFLKVPKKQQHPTSTRSWYSTSGPTRATTTRILNTSKTGSVQPDHHTVSRDSRSTSSPKTNNYQQRCFAATIGT